MKFINEGKDVQVRIPEGPNRFRWTGVRTGEEIDLPESIGSVYGFKKVGEVKSTEGKIGDTKVETKQIEVPEYNSDDLFFNELIKIKGIGKNTAEDIIRVFSDEQKLKNAIKNYDKLPFRDDIEKKLKEEYE